MLIRMVFVITWEIFHGRISLNSAFLLLLANFFGWVQVEINVYIPQCKYHIKSYSSIWFSAACAAATVHRNYFFCLYQQNKSYESKWKFRQANSCCKRVLQLPNLHMLLKQLSLSLPRNVTLGIFFKLPIMFSPKVNLQYLLYSAARRCYPLHLRKQSCLLKTFLGTLILMTWLSLYLFSLLELIWNCIISPRWLKRS